MTDEKRDARNLTPEQIERRKAIALHRMPDPTGREQLALVNALRRGSKKWAKAEDEVARSVYAMTATQQRKAT